MNPIILLHMSCPVFKMCSEYNLNGSPAQQIQIFMGKPGIPCRQLLYFKSSMFTAWQLFYGDLINCKHYRRLKCAVPLRILALDIQRTVVKYSAFFCVIRASSSLFSEQQISHRCYRWAFFFVSQHCTLKWICDWGSSTLLLEIKIMYFTPTSYTVRQRHRAQRRTWTQVKYIPLSVASSWVMSWSSRT